MRHSYLPLANSALIYDNSDEGRTLIAEKKVDEIFVVHDPARWMAIERATQ